MEKGKILIVDDDQFYQEFCTEILSGEGYLVRSTYTGEEALEILRNENFHVVLVDLVMPGMHGMEVLEKAKQINPVIDVIIMTGHASVDSAVKCLKSGAGDYLTKPLNPEELKLTVKRTIELRHLFDENAELRSLLTLYESCQRVSLCMDVEKLYHSSLDAVLQALQGELGLAFYRTDGSWQVQSYRGMDEEEAETLLDDLLKTDLDPFPDRIITIEDPEVARQGRAGMKLRISSGLAMPVKVPGLLEGYMVSFRTGNRPRYDRMDLSTARFISDQVHLSFENSLKFEDAQRLMFIDDLSGLFNTRYLDMALQTEIKRAKRFRKHLSLLFIDIDHFKDINDTYGHLVGTQVLIETANIIRSCVRDIDIVVRYGGDEFIVILVETDEDGARVVSERIRSLMEETPFRVGGDLELRVTCCVGIAGYPEDSEDRTELIHLADKAMYKGKETTRNVVYSVSELEES
ncbi:MAG: diguanylate cyclase [bacterium]